MATTSSNSHSHPVKVGGKSYATGSIGHQHTVPDQFTAEEVKALKLLIAAGGSGGSTTPVPNPPPLPTPGPVISNVVISGVTTTGATITWTTDVATTGVVVYGTGTGYGSTTAATASGTSHSRTLSGLTPGTVYHLQVRATASGQTTASSDRTFTTQQVPAPPPGTSITVASISALKAALAQNVYTEIVVTNGTYHVSPAGNRAADSLYIGAVFASRTNPVTVRAATVGGVTFDGGGATYFGALAFDQGAHHQTWDGFKFANGEPTSTGVIVFGNANSSSKSAGAHHITLTNIEFLASLVSRQAPGEPPHDQGIYFEAALGGCHDILIDGFTVNGAGGIKSAIQSDHGDPSWPNAYNVTVRNMTVSGTQVPILLYGGSTPHDWLFEDVTITGATQFGARYEWTAGQAVTFRRVTTTGSGVQGFYSSHGATPAGVTFDDCSFDA